jgi:hypothetical protein
MLKKDTLNNPTSASNIFIAIIAPLALSRIDISFCSVTSVNCRIRYLDFANSDVKFDIMEIIQGSYIK